jgi:hypothetical protein
MNRNLTFRCSVSDHRDGPRLSGRIAMGWVLAERFAAAGYLVASMMGWSQSLATMAFSAAAREVRVAAIPAARLVLIRNQVG